MPSSIHPTAQVSPEAVIGDNVTIGPFCYIGAKVTIGDGCSFQGHCFVEGTTVIGRNNKFYPFAAIGTDAEDYSYKGEETFLRIGNNNVFRENTTINRGTKAGSETVIGDDCYFMAGAHVAHNCELGNHVIMVVNSGIAGYVHVGNNVLISGLAGVHQFCRVGRFAVLSGGSTISMDLPPFMIGDGRNGGIRGINLVGLKRNNFPETTVRAIKNFYKIVFRSGMNMTNALEKVKAEIPQIPEIVELIEFIHSSKRGILHGGHADSRRS